MNEETLKKANELEQLVRQLKMAKKCLIEGKRIADETWFGGVGALAFMPEELRNHLATILKYYEEKYTSELNDL